MGEINRREFLLQAGVLTTAGSALRAPSISKESSPSIRFRPDFERQPIK
jgi:hypothetical protein